MVCKWCVYEQDEIILKEYTHWKLVLSDCQALLGWCQAVLKRHEEDFEELYDEELLELRTVIADWKICLRKSFSPDWFNEQHMGNMDKHLHLQLVPRYESSREFNGKTFSDKDFGNPYVIVWKPEEKIFLNTLANQLRKNLGE
ncbi:hypothetical protein GOV10_01110 [Candidatus Woesearchaeota archaeon]|nr:hypothetical protein [Candidatus Woesearchaeota archaeon]